jgi:high affinity sulfate transporter 1
MSLDTAAPPAWTRFAPIGAWLPRYDRAWAPADILAGLAIWAVMVPEGMAYAGIVGVPAIMGLYTIVPPLIAYAVFGTSRVLVVGPDTATGVISALTVGALAARGSGEFVALTGTLAVMIGGFFLLFGILRMGWVAAFISTPVMRGFIEGLILVTILGQIPTLLGLHGASGGFFARLWFLAQHLSQVSLPAATCGALSLAAMLLLRRFAPRIPAALVVAAAATGAIALLGKAAGGIDLVGFLPSGLPIVTLPWVDPATLAALVPGALSIVLVGYAEALGAAKAAIRPGEDLDPNQELTAHGFANLASGLFGGFLAVGSLSKTSVAIGAGARTQAANLVAAALTLLTLLVLTPLFRDLPHPALAAIVIAAMLHLSKPAYLARLAAEAQWELALAAAVIAGELTLGVLQGIALGVVASLLMLIYRTSHLASAVEGKLPGEQAYRDVLQHREAKTFPGLLIFNPGGPLFFASIGQFEHDLWTALHRSRPPARRVLIDAGAITFTDVSAREALLAQIGKLRAAGISLAFARLRDPVRAKLQEAGIVDAVGPAAFYDRLTDGVEAHLRSERKASVARARSTPRKARGRAASA